MLTTHQQQVTDVSERDIRQGSFQHKENVSPEEVNTNL